MTGLKAAHFTALRALLARLEGQEGLVWAITGSTSFALQGMAVEAHDIDLACDRDSAYRIGRLLVDGCVREVAPSQGEFIRSHFGQFVLEGMDLDLMGDSARMNLDGSWGEPAFLPPMIEWVQAEGMSLPVLSLRFEEAAYRLLRRIERADAIAAFLLSRQA